MSVEAASVQQPILTPQKPPYYDMPMNLIANLKVSPSTVTHRAGRIALPRFLMSVMALMSLVCGACDGGGNSYTQIDDDDALRIVTFAPAMTQMLIDMGLQESIVGVAENDSVAPPGTPVVGNIGNVNEEKLLSLRPTHVLGMEMGGAQTDALESLARREGFSLALYPYPRSVDAVGLILWNEREFIGGEASLDYVPSLGTVLDARDEAADLKYTMLNRLSALSEVTRGLKDTTPSVLMVIDSESTVSVSGPGSVLDELLAQAGGVNAAADAQTPNPIYTREDLIKLTPDVILLLKPNAYPLQALQEDLRLAVFRDLDIPAVRQGQIYLINDPIILLPESTAMTQIAGQIAKRLYPDQAKRIDEALESELVIEVDDDELKRSLDELSTAPPLPETTPDSSKEDEGNGEGNDPEQPGSPGDGEAVPSVTPDSPRASVMPGDDYRVSVL